MGDDFRHVLRDRTRQAHQALDLQISTFDLTDRLDFTAFLRLHQAAFGAVYVRTAPETDTAHQLADMLDRLGADLTGLGHRICETGNSDGDHFDHLAVDYVIEGSRLGSKILNKRRAEATDPAILSASTYLSAPTRPRKWREICAALSSIDPASARAEGITADTIEMFDHFAIEAAKARTGKQRVLETLQ